MRTLARAQLLTSWVLAASLASASVTCPVGQYQTALLVSDCIERSGPPPDSTLRVRAEFLQQVVAQLPAGQFGSRLQLWGSMDFDLLLYDDAADRCIVGPGCDYTQACPSEASGCISYEGMSIFYSGDRMASPVDETIRVDGNVTRAMSMRVRPSATGDVGYMYSFGAVTPCPAVWPGCALCSTWTGCLSWQEPQCDGGFSVVCTPSSSTITTTTSTTSSTSATSTTTSSSTTTGTSTTTTSTRTRSSTTATSTASTSTTSTTSTSTSSTSCTNSATSPGSTSTFTTPNANTTTTTSCTNTTSTTLSITTTNTSTATTTNTSTATTTTTTTYVPPSCSRGDYQLPFADDNCAGDEPSCAGPPPTCEPCSWYSGCEPLELPLCNGSAAVNCSAPYVLLEAATAVRDGAESGGPCSASLEVDGAWTANQTLFTKVGQGQVVSASFQVSSWPTRLRLTCEGGDSWGLQWLRLTIGERTQYLLQSTSPAGRPFGDNPYWVGGMGASARSYGVSRDILLRLEVHTSSQAEAATASPIRYSLETAGVWAENRTLFTAAAEGEVVGADVLASEWPTRVRLSAGGPDAYGFRSARLLFRGEERWLLQSPDGMPMGNGSERRLDAGARSLNTQGWHRFWLSTAPPALDEQVFTVPPGSQSSALGSFAQGPSCSPGQFRTSALTVRCSGDVGVVVLDLEGEENMTIAEFPAGAADLRFRLSSSVGLELQLLDGQTSDCIVGRSCLHATARRSQACANVFDHCIQYDGMRIHFSGGGVANQTLEVVGPTSRPLSLQVAPQSDGVATVSFSYGPLSVCSYPVPGCVPCTSVLTCGPISAPQCDGSATVACEATTTTTSSVTTATLTLTATTTATSSVTTTTLTLTATTTTTTLAPPAPQAWVVSAWGGCQPSSCGQGLRTRLVSCPGTGLGCSHVAPTWEEVCEDYSKCFESPFCFGGHGGFSCEAQHWLFVALLVLISLCLLCLCLTWHMRISCVPRRLSQRRSSRRSSSRGSQSSRPKAATERSVSCHLGEGDLKDTEVPSVDIIHCIGEPPGYFEVLHAGLPEDGNHKRSPPAGANLSLADVYLEATPRYSSPAGRSSVAPSHSSPTPLVQARAFAASPSTSSQYRREDFVASSRGDSWDIPIEALQLPSGCKPVSCTDCSTRSRDADGDPKWDHAMRIVDRTTNEISRVMVEVRTAPRRLKPRLFQRLRDLESDPEYLKAKRYLEEDHPPLAEGGKCSGGLCCSGGGDRSRACQKDSLQVPASNASMFWNGDEDIDLQGGAV